MKRILICILILSGIVGFSLWGISQTKNFKEDFSREITQAMEFKNNDQTELAIEKTKNAIAVWEKYETKISYAVDNVDLKDLGEIIAQLEYAVKNDKESFSYLCLIAKESVSHLLEEETPSLSGII